MRNRRKKRGDANITSLFVLSRLPLFEYFYVFLLYFAEKITTFVKLYR